MGIWAFPVKSSLVYSLSRSDFSEHMYIFSLSDMSDHETYYFSSVHVRDVTEPLRAYYRLNALLTILNAYFMLDSVEESKNKKIISQYPDDEEGKHLLTSFQWLDEMQDIKVVHQITKNGFCEVVEGTLREAYCRGSDPILESIELANPFQSKVDSVTHVSRLGKIISLACKDDLIRETMVYCELFRKHPFYFLINAYKIYENVKYDMESNCPINANRVGIDELLNQCEDHKHFINSRLGSGLNARHGATKSKFSKTKARPSYDEIEFDFLNLVNSWIDMKLTTTNK